MNYFDNADKELLEFCLENYNEKFLKYLSINLINIIGMHLEIQYLVQLY